MTAISTVALSNTFDYWRLRHNELTAYINTEAANNAWAVSNTVFQSALANTNSYIATKVNTTTFNSALANTNAYIATKVNTTTFNSALANTNAYIATKVNTSTFNSALANTNAYIATKVNTTTFNSALANTNTYIATKVNTSTFNSALANTNSAISDRLQVANGAILASNNDFTSTNQMRLGAPVKTTTANTYTLAIADAGFYHRLAYANTTASGNTTVGIIVPANATEAIPVGSEYLFVRTGSNSAFQFANSAGVTLNSDRGKLRVRYQWQSAVCKKVDTDEWDVIGNLAT
jgi:hypothetical protein